MKHVLVGLSVVGGLMLACTVANAEEKSNVYNMKEHIIYGNPQKPSAVIEVNKARMQLGATTPTLAALSKIQDAAKKDPF